MKFDREKSFGYPTLRTILEGDDFTLMDYPNKNFDPDLKLEIDAKNPKFLKLSYEVGLRVEVLKKMVDEKQAKFHFKVECPSTFFCESASFFNHEGEFKLPADKLKERIEITPFIIAEENLSLSSDEFHEDFGDTQFDVSKGAVLAIGRPTEYHISREQFRSVRSIFDFNKNDDVKPGDFRIRTEEQYVVVEVHSSIYEKVRVAEADRSARIFILNSLYVPVVMQLLYELKQDPDLAENKRWAATLVAKASLKGIDIEDDNAFASNTQSLLDMPFAKLAQNGFRNVR